MAYYSRIVTRNDTAANWAAENPILKAGEQGYDSTAKAIKVGDGVTAWNELEYLITKGELTARGAYSSVTTYEPNDIVSDGGSSWIAKLATTGNSPPTLPTEENTYWALFAQKGDGAGAVDSVNGQSGAVVLDPDDLDDAATTHKFATAAQIAKIDFLTVTGAANLDTGFAAASHTHAISDTAGLQTALDGKAAASHTHAISDTSGLQTALDGKAAASHTHAISDTAGLQTALDGKANLGRLAGLNSQTGTAYTLVLADLGKTVEMNNASANTLTIPTNSAAAFAVGSVIIVRQMGAGQTTIAGASGVTIRSHGNKLKLTGQYAAAALEKRATNEWCLAGNLSA